MLLIILVLSSGNHLKLRIDSFKKLESDVQLIFVNFAKKVPKPLFGGFGTPNSEMTTRT